ncbi:MAG: HAD-IC family P-type ATPase, partial [Clostridia bacterium]|nr:HAD-IC family P-type ATPase [Clostridia bacterium]
PSVDNKGYEIKEYPARGVYAFNQEVGLYVGCREFLIENSIVVPSKIISETHVYVAKDGQYVGAIIFGDTIRDGAKSLIESLKAQEIKTYLLTGDTEIVGYRVRDELLMDDVYAKLNPIEKLEKLKALAKGQAFAFVGDGINDAPVLSGADVGIAMGGGTKAAIECADVMIHNDDITKIPKLLKTAKKTMRVVYTNIIFSISVKALALVLSAVVAIPIWTAIFADVGVMLIATINSLSLSTKDKHHHHNNHHDHHHHKHECDCC